MKSFVEIVQYLFSIPGVKEFLSGWLSQDSLEKFFGCQCQRGSSNENPNAHEFCDNTQAFRVINTVCKDIPRGNCRGSKNSIDWEDESKPLPKRRKSRAANQENINPISTSKGFSPAAKSELIVKSDCTENSNDPSKSDHLTKSDDPSNSDHFDKNESDHQPREQQISCKE